MSCVDGLSHGVGVTCWRDERSQASDSSPHEVSTNIYGPVVGWTAGKTAENTVGSVRRGFPLGICPLLTV